MMDKKYFEDLLENQKKKRFGNANAECINIILGGIVTAAGVAMHRGAKSPAARFVGGVLIPLGVLNTASGGFYLGRMSILEDLIKTAPNSKEPEVTEG